VKKFLLAAEFTSAYNSNNGLSPRDPPFGKGNAENDTMHQPNSARAAHTSSQSILPKDPPFGKGM
jgi:hypothetical protein